MTPRFLRRAQVLARIPVHPVTLYRWMAAGRFPRPVAIGPRRVAWIEDEVDAWIEERAGGDRVGGRAS